MTFRLFLIFILGYSSFINLSAQERWQNFVVYSNREIPAAFNKKIFEDSRGYIWIASKNGLYKFDGQSSEPIYSYYDDSTSLTSNSINDIEEDSEGNIWIATAGSGVAKMNPYTGKIKQYPVLTPSDYPVYPVSDIFIDEDNVLWFGTGGRGIARYFPKRDSFENYIVDPDRIKDGTVRDQNAIREFAADPYDKNILWAAGMEGLFRFNKTTKKVEKFEYIIDGKKAWRDNCFHCIYIHDLQNIWLGTWSGGLVKFDYSAKKFSQFLLNENSYSQEDFSRNIVLDILPQSDSELYICSTDAGFISFNTEDKTFKSLMDKSTLPGGVPYATSMYKSKDESLWVTCDGFILHSHSLYNRFTPVIDLSAYNEKLLQHPEFTNVVYDLKKNKYLISVWGKSSLLMLNADFSFSGWIPVPVFGKKSTIKTIFFDKKGRLYAVSDTNPYLAYFDEGARMFKLVAGSLLPANKFPEKMAIRSVKFDGDRNIWIAFDHNKLMNWNIENNTTNVYSVSVSGESGLPDKVYITEITTDSLLNVWLATNTGLYCFNRENKKFTHYFSGKKTSGDIASDFINALAVDRQNKVWIAPQYQGLQVFDPDSGKVIHNYSTGRGSFSNHIDDIACDSENNIWCTSVNGLLQYNSTAGSWKIYDTRDGLPQNNLFGNIAFTKNGKIFLGIETSIVAFDPFRLAENKMLPVMHITGFNVSGKNYMLDTLPEYKKNISLSYYENMVEISFTAIETLYPEKLKFYYRLAGLDTVWKATDTRRISFASLAPGKYSFEAKAINSDGYESKRAAVISFIINKPWWQSVWFIALCVIAFVSILYTLYRYRINQILKVQQVRDKISADLHDDIGSRLTNLQLLALITKKNKTLDAGTIKNLDAIGEEVIASSEALHEIVTSIHHTNDMQKDIGIAMRRYAAQVFELSKTMLSIHIDDKLSGIKMPAEKRRDLFLSYKEIINNISKHADADIVEIMVSENDSKIHIIIKDDGKGFDTGISTSGHGLQNIKTRIQNWKGKVNVISLPGNGTTLEINFPSK